MSRQQLPTRTKEVSIDFNRPPPHINFLYILSEFSTRLLAIDRSGDRGVVPFLMKQLPEGHYKRVKEGRIPGWDALIAYYRNTQVSKTPAPAAMPSRRGRKRKSDLLPVPLPLSKSSRVEEESTPVRSDAESEDEDERNEAEEATPPPAVVVPPPASGKRRGRRRAAV